MTDIFIDFITSPTAFRFGLQSENGDIKTDDGLKTAVIYSLFTDRLASPDDVIRDGSSDRRGHWADALLADAGDSEGSRLWLLAREKQTTQTLNRAISYSREALQWLIDDSIASAVTVSGEYIRLGVLALRIEISIIDGTDFNDTFEVTL